MVGFIQNIKIWIDHNCRQESPDFKAHFRELGFIFIYMDVYIVDSELYSVFGVICVYICIYVSKVFNTECFLEVAAETWPKKDSNPLPMDSIQTIPPTKLSIHKTVLHSEPTLCSYFNFIFLFSVQSLFQPLPSSVTIFTGIEISHGHHMCVTN